MEFRVSGVRCRNGWCRSTRSTKTPVGPGREARIRECYEPAEDPILVVTECNSVGCLVWRAVQELYGL